MQIVQHFDTLKYCDPSAHTTSMSLGECGRVVVKLVSSVLLRLATKKYSVFRLVYLISEHLVCFTDTFNAYIIGF